MTYEYDVFVSYPHAGNVGAWTRIHLVPRLTDCLADEIRRPRVFFDEAMEPGVNWRETLKHSLGRSRLLLGIWSPLYFESKHCLAEWRTMVARERIFGIDGSQPSGRLVFPIRYSDGDSFPEDAQDVQQEEKIFKEFRYPYQQFKDSEKYLPFHDAVAGLAQRIARRLNDIPPWDPNWSIEFPDPPPDPDPPPLPRL